MFPLIKLGIIELPSYTLMALLGLVAFSVFAIVELAVKQKKQGAQIFRIFVTSALSFAVMYVSAFLFDALFHSIAEGRPSFGGITWEGGVVGGFTAFILLSHFIVKEEQGREIELFSSLIPGVVLAHAIGRVGCFLGGCCFGKITEGPLGVVFPSGSPAAKAYPNTQTGIGSFPVLPTQLVEAGFELLLFVFMLVLIKKLKGKNLSIYLIAYGVFRFFLEFYRGDDRGETGLWVSPSQLMSILFVLCGVLLLLFQRRLVFVSLFDKCEGWQEQARVRAKIKERISAAVGDDAIIAAKIKTLYELKINGAITEEEYEEKKEELLKRI